MAKMHRIIEFSLSLLLVMSIWSCSKAYNIKPSNSLHQSKSSSVSSSTTNNGQYRKHNPDYDDWLFYVHDLADDDLHSRNKRGFYETISNFTRTSVYNLFNWGKSSFSSATKVNNDDKDIKTNINNNATPHAVNEVPKIFKEKPIPIPRVKIRKVVDYLPENQKHCKCTSSDQVNDVSGYSRPFLFTDTFRSSHRTEDSLLPFFSHGRDKPDGPENWADAAPACGGNYQSPIALNDRNGVFINERPLKINGLNSYPTSIKQQNDGHSVKYIPTYQDGEHPSISGGPLYDEYILHHYHFHWGSTNSQGSEHTLNGREYAMEVHFVHYNKKYGSFDEAAASPMGLAVIGFFYQVNDELTDSLLSNGLQNVINWNDTNVLSEDESYSIKDLIGDVPFDFISYAGSLTTPPCYETVTWIVSTRIIDAAQCELDAFRRLKDSSGDQMVDNFRPLQKRNGRKLFYYFDYDNY